MPAPFATLEARANSAVLSTLANAVAVVGGVEVPVIFERPYSGPFEGRVDGAAPECVGPTAALGSLERDDAINVDGAAYRIVTAEPDGAGMTRLVLYTPGA
ncbi:hypothetical protein ACA040_004339 [Xenophilus aerolatus]